MSLIKNITSAVLSFGLGMLSVTSACANIGYSSAEESYTLYDSIISEKSKDLNSEGRIPFNVFDIYNAYYGIPSTTTTTTTTTSTTTSTTTTVTTTPTTTTSTTTIPTTTSTTTTTTTVPSTTSTTKAMTTETTATQGTSSTVTKATTSAEIPATTKVSSSTTKAVTSTIATSTATTTATNGTTTVMPVTSKIITYTRATTTIKTTEKSTTTTTTTTNAAIETQTSTLTSTTETYIETEPVTTTLAPGQLPAGTYLKGIDVSQWQADIDWPTVKNSGEVDFAIIKAGWGKTGVDPKFAVNMKNAQDAGMDVGVYWYSYAWSVDDAKKEAEKCLSTIEGYGFTYPVYFDIEEPGVMKGLSTATISAMVDAFCSTLEEHGYYAGVYSSASYLQYQMYRHVLQKYDVWVAEYGSSVSWYDGQYGIWQYTPYGHIPGISTNVDMNYCYKDYPGLIEVNPKDGRVPPPAKTTFTGRMAYVTTIDETDWEGFDKETYDFVMLIFNSNTVGSLGERIDKVHEYGIDCGLIYQCTNGSLDVIKADMLLIEEQLAGRKFEYPMYFEIFGSIDRIDRYGYENNDPSTAAYEFCSYFEAKKYFVGIMAEDEILENVLDKSLYELYDVWNHKTVDEEDIFTGSYGIYSEFNPETGYTEIYTKKNYPNIMKYNGLNGYTKS